MARPSSPLVPPLRAPARTPLIQLVKTGLAVVVSWFAAVAALRVESPYFAAIAALLVVQPSIGQTLGRAVERTAGVLAGVLVALAATLALGHRGWLVLVAVIVVLAGGWALRVLPASANQAAISAMLVLAIGATTPGYALDRVVETLIGAVVAVAINALVAPPALDGPARAAVAELVESTAQALESLAVLLETGGDPESRVQLLTRARALRAAETRASAALVQAQESLALNLRRGRLAEAVQRDDALLARIRPIVTQVIGMTRSVHDHGGGPDPADALAGLLGEECRRAAHDLRRLGTDAPEAQPAALTAPVAVVRPPEQDWVVVGSLLEDLRRVREEVAVGGSAR